MCMSYIDLNEVTDSVAKILGELTTP
jgi:hypothetical protein